MKPAPIKAWMVKDNDGVIMDEHLRLAVYDDERSAREYAEWHDDEETPQMNWIPVLITPLTDEGQERKEK